MSVLLDSNVLIAALLATHVHNDAVQDWLADLDDTWASCPTTQSAVIRVAMQHGYSVDEARRLLIGLAESDVHEFWSDDIDYLRVRLDGVVGHRQVTDAYLAQLARERGTKVATLDRGFAAHHSDVAVLVPS